MRVNPMAGPSYITALRNAVEQNRAAYSTPPRTGGKQMSVRLDDHLMSHIEANAELADWNRSEVLYAFAYYGLWAFYESAPEIADKAVASIMAKFTAHHASELDDLR